MRQLILALVLTLLVSWAPPAFAAEPEEAPPPVLVDAFEDADLASTGYGAWLAVSDKDKGGTTAAIVAITEEGFEDEAAAHLTWKLGEPFTSKEGKPEHPYAFLGLLMGEKFGVAVDLTGFTGLSFQARALGVSEAQVVVISVVHKPFSIWVATIPLAEDWGEVRLTWDQFEARGETVEETLDPAAVTMLAVGTGWEGPPGQRGELFLDLLQLLPKSQRTLDREAAETVTRQFHEITFQAPVRGWQWGGKKLTSKGNAAEIEFRTYVIDGWRRVPFGEGITADPGNITELQAGYVSALRLNGLTEIKETRRAKIKIGRQHGYRYGVTATCSPELRRSAPQLGERIYIECVFFKEGGQTYHLTALMPETARDQLLETVRRVIASIRPAG